MAEKRNSGIDFIGYVPWGTHICQFYQTKDDLLDILVPYFKAGLENNEYCMWVTAEPLDDESAREAMRKSIPDFDLYLERGQIEIIPYDQWYLLGGAFDLDRVLTGWTDKLDHALKQGYDGLRVTGNITWLEKNDWESFTEYERKINSVIGNYKMMIICPYRLDRCSAAEVIDVVSNHQFALVKRAGKWGTIQSTEHQRLEQAIIESREEYRLLFERTTNPILVIDSEGNYLDGNAAALAFLECTREELLSRNISDFIPPDKERKAIKEQKSLWTRGGTIETECLVHGKVKNLEFTFTPLDVRGKAVIFGDGRDTTQTRQAEEALQKAEENFRRSLDDSPLGIHIVTAEGKTLYANRAILNIYGYDSIRELDATPREKRYTAESYAEHQERKKKRKQGEYTSSNYEIGIVRKTGEIHHLEAFRKEVLWDGEPQFQMIYHDITERKLMQKTLAAERECLKVTLRSTGDGVISTDLEGKVVLVNRVAEELTGWTQGEAVGKPLSEVLHIIDENTRKRIDNPVKRVLRNGRITGLCNHAVLISRDGTERIITNSGAPIQDEDGRLFGVVMVFRDVRELRKLEEEVQKTEKLQSIGTLAGGIAHDFNNLLTGILGNITLAERYIEPGGEAAERLLEARNASMRAKDLTQQLLTFSKGGTPVKKTAFVAELIQNNATFALRGSKSRCEFSLPDDLRMVEVDEGQMSQVITNLVINADQAMPGGGIINIGAENIVIKGKGVLPLPKGNYVKITVEDHGVGIPKEHLGKVFEPYFTTKQKGSGLGLATTYSIIKNHDGYITVESKLGVGATFHIYLPASEKPMPAKGKAVAEARVAGKGSILVMDDEEMIREMLGKLLSLAGYDTELSKDGAEAVELYKKAMEAGQPFDAVILDLTIPGGMGGREAIKKLLEIDPHVKAIVSSGYSTDPIMADFKKYGFSAVVTKPYSAGDLEKTLHNVLTK